MITGRSLRQTVTITGLIDTFLVHIELSINGSVLFNGVVARVGNTDPMVGELFFDSTV